LRLRRGADAGLRRAAPGDGFFMLLLDAKRAILTANARSSRVEAAIFPKG
jgi:hypothetical protein